jgi:hypothetical protein
MRREIHAVERAKTRVRDGVVLQANGGVAEVIELAVGHPKQQQESPDLRDSKVSKVPQAPVKDSKVSKQEKNKPEQQHRTLNSVNSID